MKNRLLAFFAVLMLGLGVFAMGAPGDVYAAGSESTDTDCNGVTDDGFIYTYSGGNATITGIDDSIFSPKGALAIPGTIKRVGDVYDSTTGTYTDLSLRVIAIGDEAFQRKTGITGVTFPAGSGGNNAAPTGITSIGARAFYQCYALTSVSIPGTVTSIGSQAFSECDALAAITVAAGNNYYVAADNALYEMNGGSFTLKQYAPAATSTTFEPKGTIVSRITAVGDGAFAGASKLENLKLPDTVTSIGDSSFKNCTALKTAALPSRVTTISNSAFEGCRLLESIELPDYLTSIGDSAFKDCVGLKSLTFGSSLNTIGASAFYNCSSLSELTLPYQLLSIGDYAFYDCNDLIKVVIPVSVNFIGTNAFSNSGKLAIYTHQNTTAYNYANSNRISVIKTWTVRFYSDQNELLKSEEVVDGSDATPPDMGAREGYTLVWSAPYTNVRADVSVVASWTRTYIVTFSDVYNDRTATAEVEPGKSTTPPGWTMSGYNLKWDVSEGSYNNVYANGTVYAQWVDPATGFTITKDTKKPQSKNSTFVSGTVTYTVASADVQNPTVKYTANSDAEKTSISIPATVSYEGVKYKVCYVAKEAFLNNTVITSVTIGANVKQIGDSSFSGCTALAKIKIKSKVITKFGDSCFYNIKKKATIYTYPSKKAVYKKKITASGLAKKASFTYKSL